MKKMLKKIGLLTMCLALLGANLSYAATSEEPTLYTEGDAMSYIMQLSDLDIMKISLYDYDGNSNLNTIWDTNNKMVMPQFMDGIYYVPLRLIAENLGYSVKWNNDTKSVMLTDMYNRMISLQINSHEYSVSNSTKMLHIKNAPMLKNDHTMVPLEFVGELFNKYFTINNNNLILYKSEATMHSGYVKNIRDTKNGYQLIISNDLDATLEDCVILNVSSDTVINLDNNKIHIGDYIYAFTSMATTKSIPPQTNAYLIY